MSTPDLFYGYRIITSEHLTETTFVERPYSWAAWHKRIWRWTWWVTGRTTYTEAVTVPSRQIIQLGNDKLLMHPQMARELERFSGFGR